MSEKLPEPHPQPNNKAFIAIMLVLLLTMAGVLYALVLALDV